MTSLKVLLMVLFLLKAGEGAAWDCYNGYCLVSFGLNLSLSCIPAAQTVCFQLSPDAYPLELIDKNVMSGAIHFIQTNGANLVVLLNAHRIAGDTYYWIRKEQLLEGKLYNENSPQLDCTTDLYILNGIVSCNGNATTFNVICMIDCPYTWIIEKHMPIGGFKHSHVNNLEGCKRKCININKCMSVTFGKTENGTILCKTYTAVVDSWEKIRNAKYYVFLRNQYKKCLHGMKDKNPALVTGNCEYQTSYLQTAVFGLVSVCIVLVVLLIHFLRYANKFKFLKNWNIVLKGYSKKAIKEEDSDSD